MKRTITVKIDSDNQAVVDDPDHATRDAMRRAARGVQHGATRGTLRDVNGNPIGEWELQDGES